MTQAARLRERRAESGVRTTPRPASASRVRAHPARVEFGERACRVLAEQRRVPLPSRPGVSESFTGVPVTRCGPKTDVAACGEHLPHVAHLRGCSATSWKFRTSDSECPRPATCRSTAAARWRRERPPAAVPARPGYGSAPHWFCVIRMESQLRAFPLLAADGAPELVTAHRDRDRAVLRLKHAIVEPRSGSAVPIWLGHDARPAVAREVRAHRGDHAVRASGNVHELASDPSAALWPAAPAEFRSSRTSRRSHP